jgi:tRNA dimethylallyltransferase
MVAVPTSTMTDINQIKKSIKTQKTFIVIAGPTAVGKTKIAIELAINFKAEIISADSRQFYKEIPIGTAQPNSEELQQAKHHFIANKSIVEQYNVSDYAQDVEKFCSEYFLKNDTLIMVGGSGLFIDAFCNGLDDIPDVDENLREELNQLFEKEGIEVLQNELKAKDPEYFEIVDQDNPRRLIRALEIIRHTGNKYSSLRKKEKKQHAFEIIKIGLNQDRNELYEKINKRVDLMLENGLVEEAKSVLKYRKHNALNTVGYKELFDYFDQKTSLEEAVELIKRNSRRYAKRQMTWFKKDEAYIWFDHSSYPKIVEFLNSKMP